MGYDSARQRVVLFGGWSQGALADTWEWDGKNWTQLKPTASPSARGGHAIAYDCHRQRTVLFGGTARTILPAATWELGAGPVRTLRTCTTTASIANGGTQKFALHAGSQHATRFYWILGSVTGTTPGINLGGLHFPLNPDFYTDFTIGFPNTNILMNSRGKLDARGQGPASLNVPKGLPIPLNLPLNHAYLVYDAQSKWHMVSNPVPLTLVK